MTPKRAKFVSEYLRDFNGTQAAVRAGYSPRTARIQANQLLSKLDIAAAIAAERDKSRTAAVLSLAEAQEIASAAARGEYDAKCRDRLAALDRMAKFNGWDKPAQLDVTSGGQRLETLITFAARDPNPEPENDHGQEASPKAPEAPGPQER